MTCQTCRRTLVAQRTWREWDRSRRKAVSRTHAKAHSKDYCVGCYQAAYRSGFTPGDPGACVVRCDCGVQLAPDATLSPAQQELMYDAHARTAHAASGFQRRWAHGSAFAGTWVQRGMVWRPVERGAA